MFTKVLKWDPLRSPNGKEQKTWHQIAPGATTILCAGRDLTPLRPSVPVLPARAKLCAKCARMGVR